MKQGLSRLPDTQHLTLIFETTWAGALTQKATTLGLTAFFWATWLSLWAPLFTYLFWLLAPFWGASTVISAGEDSLPVLALLTATGFALSALLVLAGALQWAFGAARTRPAVTDNVTMEQLSSFHGLTLEQLNTSWDAKRLVIHHNEDSSISSIEWD